MLKDSTLKTAKNKRFKIRYAILALVSVFLVCMILVSAYVWKLLGTPTHTDVPIVTGGDVSDGILDSLPDVDDITDPVVSEDSNVSSSPVSNAAKPGGAYVPTTWGSGRVKLYVDSRFPIIKTTQKDPNVENILIIGVDARSVSEKQSRTDSIMVVSIDKNSKSIKLTSFMRDSEVKIPGRTTPTKINAAYVYGGIGLLINTMNQNFDLDIQKFAMVDMYSAETVIDAAGGVTINITKGELELINSGVAYTNYIFSKISKPSPALAASGIVLLNGRQAVAYGRIRHIGNDQGRTLRQRTVLTALITSFKAASVSRKMNIFEAGFQGFETSMSKSDMLFLAFDALSGMKNIKQYRVPEDGMYQTNLSNYNMVINSSKQIPALHRFIWGNSSTATIPLPEEGLDPTATPTIAPTKAPTATPGVSVKSSGTLSSTGSSYFSSK